MPTPKQKKRGKKCPHCKDGVIASRPYRTYGGGRRCPFCNGTTWLPRRP